MLVFSISIVPSSAALSYASASGSYLLVGLILIFAMVTLVLGIALAPVKLILLFGIVNLLIALAAIIYAKFIF